MFDNEDKCIKFFENEIDQQQFSCTPFFASFHNLTIQKMIFIAEAATRGVL